MAPPGTRHVPSLAIRQHAIDFLLHVDRCVELLALKIE
jgi:hypothetical protein